MSLYALYRSQPQPGRCKRFATPCREISAVAPAIGRSWLPRGRCTSTRAWVTRRIGHSRERLLAIRVTREKRLSVGRGGIRCAHHGRRAHARTRATAAGDSARGRHRCGPVGDQETAGPADDHLHRQRRRAQAHPASRSSYIEFGAAVSLTDAFVELTAEYPELQEIARRFASPPICNAGTLCGNIANGSPIGDSMPALICLGTSVVLQSATGHGSSPLEDFYLDYMKKDLRPGEFVAAVRVPRALRGLSLRSYKIAKRYDQDISAVCAAFAVELAGGRIRRRTRLLRRHGSDAAARGELRARADRFGLECRPRLRRPRSRSPRTSSPSRTCGHRRTTACAWRAISCSGSLRSSRSQAATPACGTMAADRTNGEQRSDPRRRRRGRAPRERAPARQRAKRSTPMTSPLPRGHIARRDRHQRDARTRACVGWSSHGCVRHRASCGADCGGHSRRKQSRPGGA